MGEQASMQHGDLQRFAQLALDSVGREYPYHLSRVLSAPGEIESPRTSTPVFYGCFDWHSAVHGHWLLAYAMRQLAGSPFADTCRETLRSRLDSNALLLERDHLQARPGFERPYGIAWVLALAAELQRHDDEETRGWREAIRPLEFVAAEHLATWLPKLMHPVRCGTHAQTAFAMSLAWDWADTTGDEGMTSLLRERALSFFGDDHDYALHLEPSGEDFLSASLGAASLMSRVLTKSNFKDWLDRTMPKLGRSFDFMPVTCSDRSDGRLTHLDGLNLSRAWMLHDIALALDIDLRVPLLESATIHASRGLEGMTSEHYAGSHWLGTFAAYLSDRASRTV